MAESTTNDEIRLISKGLYRIVSDILGPGCIVKLRRQGYDIRDAFLNCVTYMEETTVTCGSRAEGFDFESSDYDIMYIDRMVIVLTRSIAAQFYDMPTVLLIETENVTPGFAFIKCLKYDRNNESLKNTLVLRGKDVYISAKQIRESFLSRSISKCHGPCQTSYMNGLEVDEAFTVRCPIWPKQAISFVKRSLQHGWLSYEIVTSICKDGCLLVPVNSKQQQYSDMEDLQWRMSFSLAEKKIVRSMNHTQFLCYGLLKLFLNEILKNVIPVEDLLCSYFMKTVVFWEMFENPSSWSPLNFFLKFCNCISRLMKWVRVGYCPNFFIPEQNMFYGKTCGEKQFILLGILRDFYTDAFWSLLRCPSLFEHLSSLIIQPKIAETLSVDEMDYVPSYKIEKERIRVILNFDIYINVTEKDNIMKTMIYMLMINTESTDIICALRLGVNHIQQTYAQNLYLFRKSAYSITYRNRMKYNDNKVAKSILQRTKTFLCMNYFILIKHFYISGNYHRTIEMIHYIIRKLQCQPYMYRWKFNDNIIMAALQQGISYDTLVTSLIVSYVQMDKDTAVEELIPECLAYAETTGSSLLYIPPLVFLNFLLILSYTRLGENQRRYDILDELHTLLYRDDGNHIHSIDKALSWEILGICQQLCGHREGAIVSYLHSLDDEYNYFKQATLERMNSLRSY